MKLRMGIILFAVALWTVPNTFAELKMTPDIRSEMTFENQSDGSTFNSADFGGRLRWTLEGRIENKDTKFYVYGKVQPLAKVDGTLACDDSFGQFGTSTLNVTLGRFEAELLLEKSEDIFVVSNADSPAKYSVPAPYRVDNAWGRQAADFMIDYNPSANIGLELSGLYGNKTDEKVAVNQFGLRPMVKYMFTLNKTSNVTVKAGFDYLTYQPKDKDAEGEKNKVGFGGEVVGVFDKIKVSAGAASFQLDGKNYADGSDRTKQRTTTVNGTFVANVGKNIIGLGTYYTTEDLNDSKEWYTYAAFEYRLPVPGTAFLKFAPAFAVGTDTKGVDVKSYGMRIRFDYYL